MPPKRKKKSAEPGARTEFQRFDSELVHRSKISKAPYNPRVIDDEAKKRLKRKLKSVGLLQPLVWNRRTGNLVSGHQRLEILDSLEGREDYSIEMAVVDLDDKTEREMVVFLNNPSAMGDWDIEALAAINLDFGIEFKEMGFSDFDVDFMFDGDSRFSKLFEDDSDVRAAKNVLDKIKENRDQATDKLTIDNSADFYFVVVCGSQAEKDALMKKLGVPRNEQYVSSGRLDRFAKAQSEE